MLSRSQAINAVNIYDVTCVRTSRYSAGSSNPQSLARLSIWGWHRISNASQIFSLKWFSTVAMTATLPPSYLPVPKVFFNSGKCQSSSVRMFI